MSEIVESVDLVKVEVLNAVQVFTGGGMNAILDQIESKVRAIQLDPSTAAGREEIRSVAYRVVRTKTTLDAEGKKLTEEWRKNTTLVNAERKKSIERLEALAEEVRKPLTEFENKERKRVAAHEDALSEMAGLLVMLQAYPDMAASLLEDHLLDFHQLHADRDWEEFGDRAARLRKEVNVTLIGRIEARNKFDADQAELSRLRQEEADRKQRERDESIARAAAEQAQIQAELKAKEAAEVEGKRVAAEAEKIRLEHERVRKEADAKLAKEKADRLAAEALAEQKRLTEENARLAAEKRAKDAEAARIASQKKAEAEKLAADVRAAAELKAAQDKAKRDADAAAQRERDKIDRERKKAEAEQLKREADEANKARVRTEIIEDLSIGEFAPAPELVDRIMGGKVRNVRVIY